MQSLRQVEGTTVGGLLDLLPAAKTVGQNERMAIGLPHSRQEDQSADL